MEKVNAVIDLIEGLMTEEVLKFATATTAEELTAIATAMATLNKVRAGISQVVI